MVMFVSDDERCITVEKRPGDTTFGFHIKGSNPVAISTVEADSAAEGAGVKISEVVIAINDVNVLEATHQEAIKLISQGEFILDSFPVVFDSPWND